VKVGVRLDEVARAQPAVVHDRRGLVGHLVVAPHDRRVAQLELADLADGHLPVVGEDPGVVHVAELGMLAHRAERSVWALAVRPDQGVGRLREPVPAHDLETEAGLDLELALPLR
jgi:hypothetical protein